MVQAGSRALVLALLLLVVPAAVAHGAAFRLGSTDRVRDNPAEKYAGRVIEEHVSYRNEVPRRCSTARHRGVDRFAAWLARRTGRAAVVSRTRCERLGSHGPSFHSDGRAIDVAFDAARPSDARTVRRLLRTLLAEDSAGEPAALARRIGILEIIWDCGYWGQGAAEFRTYDACRRKRASKTVQHRDHVHFSLTRAGAAARTSFWRRVGAVPKVPVAPALPEFLPDVVPAVPGGGS